MPLGWLLGLPPIIIPRSSDSHSHHVQLTHTRQPIPSAAPDTRLDTTTVSRMLPTNQLPPQPYLPRLKCQRTIMPFRLLTINAGSSSMKICLYQVDTESQHPRLIQSENKNLHQTHDPVKLLKEYLDQHTHEEANTPPVRIVIHRIVHGGPLFHKATLLTQSVLAQLETLNTLAPLHNPPALKWIHAAQKAFPPSTHKKHSSTTTSSSSSTTHSSSHDDSEISKHAHDSDVQHVAIFDTGFFHHLPPTAQEYALPRELVKKYSIRRYGFHGIAHQSMLDVMIERCRLKEKKGGRLITLQLGSGCSAAAILNGQPVETSMGFTPLEGLIMATRTGDVDPALITFLQEHEPSLSKPAAMEDMMYHKSGFVGLSGGESNDMKTLEQSNTPGAQLSIDVFLHRVLKYIGAYVAVLGGLDTLVFGGGIGEHAAPVRKALCERLQTYLPMELDLDANEKAKGDTTRLSTDSSKVEIWLVAVDEGSVMVRDALKLTKPEDFKSQL